MALCQVKRAIGLCVWLLPLSATPSAGCEAESGTRHALQRSANPAPSALELVLASHEGSHPIDARIRALQQRIPTSKIQVPELERLGWAFIARARELSDPGSYNLALQSALAIEAIDPASRAAQLLRGHALHSLHHFREAERLARSLVAERGLPVDFGLLGDVLLDRGQLTEAIDNYQRMIDLRPDMHSYGRAAQARYLVGDLPAALEAMQMAARSASPRNAESFAWTWSKLGHFQLQSGRADEALASAQRALAVFPDSYHAHKLQGSVWLSKGELARAIPPLRAAAQQTPHPEVLWMLLEALDGEGRASEADAVRSQLRTVGASEDPRTFALYLATQNESLALAEQLVRAELVERQDVYTYEALAWVQSARGEHASALDNAQRSLRAGTQDPRLYYHAGLVAERAGDVEHARSWLALARDASGMLLPSQRALLAEKAERWTVAVRTHRRDPTTQKGKP